MDRQPAGALDYGAAEPDLLADLLVDQIEHPPAPRDVETTGAASAAALIAELL